MGNANSGRYPKLRPDERRRIIELVADGMAAKDVAVEVARSASMVRRVICEAGGVARRTDWDPSPARLSAADREEIRAGLEAGQSFRLIAKGLGRAPSTICQGPVSCARGRTVVLPGGGQQNCPVVARCSARGSVGQGRDSFAGGGLGEADAVAGGEHDVCVVQEPVDGRVGDGLGHEFVEAGGVQVG